MSLKYERSSESLLISVKQLFLDWEYGVWAGQARRASSRRARLETSRTARTRPYRRHMPRVYAPPRISRAYRGRPSAEAYTPTLGLRLGPMPHPAFPAPTGVPRS
jgi:hypothetical protein